MFFSAQLIFNSRELAKTCLRTNKDVNIEDKKVTMFVQGIVLNNKIITFNNATSQII